MTLEQVITGAYPKAVDCLLGHIGFPIWGIQPEIADDRTYDYLICRCSHCYMPVGGDILI